MTRTYVERYGPDETPDYEEAQQSRGYFDISKTRTWPGATEWNGSNNVDINTRDRGIRQNLHRTASGRWVLDRLSSYSGDRHDTYYWRTDDQAREWLMFNDHDAAVAEFFSDQPEERGPG